MYCMFFVFFHLDALICQFEKFNCISATVHCEYSDRCLVTMTYQECYAFFTNFDKSNRKGCLKVAQAIN